MMPSGVGSSVSFLGSQTSGASFWAQAEHVQKALAALGEMFDEGRVDLAVLEQLEDDADALRNRGSRRLNEAFATPYDREDIQRAIEHLDWIVTHTLVTAREMDALGVTVDATITDLVELVRRGASALVQCLEQLDDDKEAAGAACRRAQTTDRAARRRYERGLVTLFATKDPLEILRRREIYHHLKDAAKRIFETAVVLDAIRVKSI